LNNIKYTLGGIGKIRNYPKKNVAFYIVESFEELKFILDHFEKYPLVSAKILDFLSFKKCYEIIKKKEHLTEDGLLKILSLKSSLNKGLSEKIKKNFSNIEYLNRSEYIFKGIPDPN
jgi:hypothetical protein